MLPGTRMKQNLPLVPVATNTLLSLRRSQPSNKGPGQRMLDMGMPLRVDGDHTVRIGVDGIAFVHDVEF